MNRTAGTPDVLGQGGTSVRSRCSVRGLRMRSAVAACAVLALIFAGGSVLLVGVLRQTLMRSVQTSAELRARDVAAEVARGAARSGGLSLQPRLSELSVAQVSDRRGVVLAASPAIAGEPVLAPLSPAPGQRLTATRSLGVAAQEPFFIVALGVAAPEGDLVVMAAESTAAASRTTDALAWLLGATFPVAILVLGAAVWMVVGHALRPVEAMRVRVAGISSKDLTQRVEPTGAGDEIDLLAATMNQMLGRLQHAQRAQRTFTADASHELRSPLASIRAAVEVMAASPQPNESTETAELVLRDCDRLDRLVHDLLLLAKADEAGLAALHEDVDLDDIVLAEAGRLRRRSDLEVRVAVVPCRVTGDRRQLERLVGNLCENAARFAASRIELSLELAGGDQARLVVHDDGPGIPPSAREQVFARFVRLDVARGRDEGGSGLGLAIVREVARAHGGTVGVLDSVAGTRIEVRLPGAPGSP